MKGTWLSTVVFTVSMGVSLSLGTRAARAHEHPFQAVITGNAHLTPTSDPNVMRNDETGEGYATDLGHFTWQDVELADFSAFPDAVYVIGWFTMTADNGAKLFGVFTTVGHPTDPVTLVIHGT